MVPLDIADWIVAGLQSSLILAIPVAIVAGLLSFFSPCVVPLVPGYLSYATGLAAGDVLNGTGSRRRMLLGTGGFILGISAVFVTTGAAFGGLGSALLGHQRLVTIIAGIVSIVMGLAFAGWLPLFKSELKPNFAPRFGIAAAPLLGIAFAVGWTPCIGPALTVVLTLAFNEQSASRGALLAFCYSLGLGLPFLIIGLAFNRFSGALAWVRKHQRGVMRAGGIVMIIVGVAMVSGLWDAWMAGLRQWAAGFEVPI